MASRGHLRDRAFLACLAIAASIAGLANDFVYDDIPIIRDNTRVHSLANIGDLLMSPYWPPPFVEQLYRPLTVLVLALEFAIGNGAPLVFRLVSYALYAVAVLVMFGLARQLLTCRTAIAATALFAVHPVHVEAVALGVGQAELIVAILGIAMVSLYLRKRRGDGLLARDWLLLATLYSAAALAKESGFVLPALLVATELLLVDDSPLRRRFGSVWAGYAALASVAVATLLVRGAVLAEYGIGAVRAHALDGLDVGHRALTMLQVVPMWFRLLAWPARLQVDYAPHEIATPSALGAPELAGLALLAAALVIIVACRRRAPVVAFGLVWCAITLAPVSNIIPSGILLAERTLFLPSVGFLLATGAVAQAVVAKWNSAVLRRVLITGCCILALLGIVRSASRHNVWNSAHLVIVKRPAPR